MHKKTKSDIERLEYLISKEEEGLAECTDPDEYREKDRKIRIMESRLDDLYRNQR
jgi:hypothetical protein